MADPRGREHILRQGVAQLQKVVAEKVRQYLLQQANLRLLNTLAQGGTIPATQLASGRKGITAPIGLK